MSHGSLWFLWAGDPARGVAPELSRRAALVEECDRIMQEEREQKLRDRMHGTNEGAMWRGW